MKRTNLYSQLLSRLHEPRRFIQVLAGPRQVGKTTLVRQVMQDCGLPAHYASADEPSLRDQAWLEQQWDLARIKARSAPAGALLVIDEVQKAARWPDIVKLMWDADTHTTTPLKVVLLGSSPLLLQSGLTESLAGRFETIPVAHWSFGEMKEAFGWDLERFICFGGYPGAAPLADDPERWRQYLNDSLIEITLSRDILLLNRVDKPALLRRLIQLACAYSGHILAYQKMLGQLVDAGNTVTLAHYLHLLEGAGMVAGLSKFSSGQIRQRASSPKLQVLNTALMTAQSGRHPAEWLIDRDAWGRLVESAVGAHLVNTAMGSGIQVTYWRERNLEVDFVLQRGDALVAIEVKSGGRKDTLPGIAAFDKAFKPTAKLLVGGQGIPISEFLDAPAAHWLAEHPRQ
ncbi:MAG: ATP-binding protein [Verrucomicrobia bacterium]|nr:ATP-binding protein [Verrucomicrobiota bacterium]